MRIRERKIGKFLVDLASKKPAPGGGSASALSGAMAAALVVMVGELTVGKKKYQDVEESFQKIISQAKNLQEKLTRLIDEDAQAFLNVIKTKNSPTAIKKAAKVPLKTAQNSLAVLKMAVYASDYGNQNCRSDAFCAIELATAAIYGGLENVQANLPFIKDKKFEKEIMNSIEVLLKSTKKICPP